VYCAVCARQLAHGAGLPLPQRLFIAGLMHNIGNLVIAHELPDTYRDILALARTQELPLADIERRVLGFDYADVGAELMRQWNLPSGLIYPVALHTRPLSEVSAAEQPWVAVVQVAAATARAATWVDAGSEPIPDYDPIAIALLGVDAERIEALMQETDEQVSEFVAILLPNA
jgi:HD-like signal output (HDOD) protein